MGNAELEKLADQISAFPYVGINRIRFKGTFSILYRIPLKPITNISNIICKKQTGGEGKRQRKG